MRHAVLRTLAALVAATALSGSVPAYAQSDEHVQIIARVRDSVIAGAVPGATIWAKVSLKNYSLVPITVTPRLVLPTGWSVASGDAPFGIAELDTREWIITARIPASADTGSYTIAVWADVTTGSSIRESVRIAVVAGKPAVVARTRPAARTVAARGVPVTSLPPAAIVSVAPAAPRPRSMVSSLASSAPSASGDIVVEAGATVTRGIRVANRSSASLSLSPSVDVPSGWSVPMGMQPFAVAAGETELWMVSLRVPARAPAGRYSIAVAATSATNVVAASETLHVTVRARHALELALTNRASYVVAGDRYEASFLLQNRGNVRTTVVIAAASSLGGAVRLDSSRVTLEPASSRAIAVQVTARSSGQESRDDVLELRAVDAADTSVVATASSNVTVVQRAGASEPLHRVASQLRLRAAAPSVGVSPFDFTGGGALRDGGSEQLSFVLRGPAGPASPFGDQDQYRVELRGNGYTARAGDALYRASDLSSSGQSGFGGGVDLRSGALSGGAFMQRFRTQPDGVTERGAYLGFHGDSVYAQPELSVSALTRTNGPFAGRVLSATGAAHPIAGATVELELARSSGPVGDGTARRARISGGDRVRYDAGHTEADDAFAGIYRGATHDYANVSARASEDVQVTATAGAHDAKGITLGQLVSQRTDAGTLEVTYRSRFTLQYSALTRSSELALLPWQETQRGILARADQSFGVSRLWGSAGMGSATSGVEGPHPYRELTLGGSTVVGAHSLSMYGETSDGMSISRGADRLVTVGGDARLQFGAATALTVAGFSTHALTTTDRYTQLDAALSRQLASAGTVSLRLRIAGNPSSGVPAKQLVFMEYSAPMQMPIGRTSAAGRVRGQVVDRQTGRGVAGMLVRLGRQAALTDNDGRVAFAGLDAGDYRLVVAQRTSSTPTVFTGDAIIHVDSARHAPVTFKVAIEPAGRVDGIVRRMITARTGIGSAPDSLGDGGPMDGVDLMLISARDTLYAASTGAGTFVFPEVSSGHWTLRVLTLAPTGAYWAPVELDVLVAAGTASDVTVRLVPRRRAVQMIDGDAVPVRP